MAHLGRQVAVGGRGQLQVFGPQAAREGLALAAPQGLGHRALVAHGHRDVVHRRERGTQQGIGGDRHRHAVIVHLLQREARRHPGHVVEHRAAHLAADALDLGHRGRAFDEAEIGPGVEVGVHPVDRIIERAADRAAGIAACDQHEVGIDLPAHRVGRADLACRLGTGDHLAARYMAAALGQRLVFEVDRSHAGLDVFTHRARDVHRVAIAVVGIGDDRDRDRVGDPPGIGVHLGHRREADVGHAQLRDRRAVSGHVNCLEPGHLDHARADGVEASRHEHGTSGSEQPAQAGGGAQGGGSGRGGSIGHRDPRRVWSALRRRCARP